LRNLTIDRLNQVWATDITCILMPKRFQYLVVIMDWRSRKVLFWRLSNSMDADFCIDALQEALLEALTRYGKPEIFNSDLQRIFALSPSKAAQPPLRSRKAACSPASTSPACCRRPRSRSAWTARDAASTMFSWKAYGAV
jgi:transposase InsO family protein